MPSATSTTPEFHYELDLLSQTELLQCFINVSLLFEMPADSITKDAVVERLETGCRKMAASFPWFGGQIVFDAKANRYKATSLENWKPLVIKDWTNDPKVPSYANIVTGGVNPLTTFNEFDIAPRLTVPGHPSEKDKTDMPVFTLGVIFIRGGLLLDVCGHHAMFDIVGMDSVCHMLARVCRGQELTDNDIRLGTCDRTSVIDTSDVTLPENMPPLVPSSIGSLTWEAELTRNDLAWYMLRYSKESLAALKDYANESKPESVEFISTDDTVASLLWKSLTIARMQDTAGDTETKMLRVVDMRRFLGLDDAYPGLCISNSSSASNYQGLADMPLGEVAALLRRNLDPATTSILTNIKMFAALLKSTPIGPLPNAIAVDTSKDFIMTSWCKSKLYSLDLGDGLEKPAWVFKAMLAKQPGLCYGLPKRLDGGVDVMICLRKVEMESLQKDEIFTRFTRVL